MKKSSSKTVVGHGKIRKSKTYGAVGVIALGASLALGGVSTAVHADEVVQPTEGVVAKEADGVQPATAQDVASAKTEADVASAAVKAQEGVVAKTTQNISATETAKADAEKKVAEYNKVTEEAVNTAKTEANTATAEAEKAAGSLETANTEAQAKQAQVDAQSKVVEDDTQAVKDAQTKVDSLSKPADIPALEKSVSDKEKAVAEDTKAKEQAQKDLDNVKEAIANKETAIQNAEAKVTTDQGTYASAQAETSSARGTSSEAKTALDSAKTKESTAKYALDALKGRTVTIPDVQLSQTYIDALNTYNNIKNSKEVRAEALKTLETESAKLLKQNMPLFNDKAEYDRTLDFDNLKNNGVPADLQKELTLFTAEVFNKFRAIAGTVPTKVTEGALVASKEINDNSEETYYHSQTAQDKARDKYNIAVGETLAGYNNYLISKKGDTWVTNAYGGQYGKRNLSVGSMKEGIYQSILGMLFDDTGQQMGHARSVLGYSNNVTDHSPVKQDYLGVGFKATYDDLTKDNIINARMNTFEKLKNDGQDVEPNANFDLTEIKSDLASRIADAQTNYDNAKADVATKQAAYDQAQTELQAKQQAEATALATLNASKQALADIKSGNLSVEPYEAALAKATAKLEADTKALATAREALETAKLSEADRATALETAKGVLATAQAKLTADTEALSTLNTELKTLKDAQVRAKAVALSTAEIKQRKVAEADRLAKLLAEKAVELPKLETAIEGYTTKLAELKALLAQQLADLEPLKATSAEATARYRKVKAEYDEVVRKEKLARQKADIESRGGTAVEVKDVSGRVVEYRGVFPQSAPKKLATPVVYRGLSVYKPSEKQLPSTGTTKNAMLPVIGLALAGVGMMGLKKKEEE